VLHVAVSSPESSLNRPNLSIRPTNSTDTSSYGEQFPFNIKPEFDLAYAADHSDEGPVYHFQASYDRIVLLADDQLSFLGQPQHEAGSERRGKITPGDRTWTCYFNSTVMEVFVYMSQRIATTPNSTNGANNTTKASFPLPFPFVVQIIEKWVQNGTRAYCEQQNVSEQGAFRKSDAPRYFLSTTTTSSIYGPPVGKNTKQSGMAEGACQCQWIVQ
jgi:hypothetical protein